MDTRYGNPNAMNFSTLKAASKGAAALRWAMDHKPESTPAMAFGSLVHLATLQPHLVEAQYAVYPGATRRGKEWDAFVEANAGKEIVKADEMEQALLIAAAVRAHPVASLALAEGRAEVELAWRDLETGIECKGRTDWIGGGCVFDLKTTQSVDTHDFTRTIAQYDYHAQLAFYVDGARHMGMDVGAAGLIGVEKEGPFDVIVAELDADVLEAGRILYRQWLRLYARCLDTDTWPGRHTEVVRIQLPQWKLAQ